MPGGRPALSKPGLGREVLTGHISCVEGKGREKKGETKRVEQNGGREDGKGSEERRKCDTKTVSERDRNRGSKTETMRKGQENTGRCRQRP